MNAITIFNSGDSMEQENISWYAYPLYMVVVWIFPWAGSEKDFVFITKILNRRYAIKILNKLNKDLDLEIAIMERDILKANTASGPMGIDEKIEKEFHSIRFQKHLKNIREKAYIKAVVLSDYHGDMHEGIKYFEKRLLTEKASNKDAVNQAHEMDLPWGKKEQLQDFKKAS